MLQVHVVFDKLVILTGRSVAGFAHTRYALDGYLSYAIFEATQTCVALVQLVVLLFVYEFVYDVLLFLQNQRELHVLNVGIELTAHECGAFILFYVTLVQRFVQVYLRCEALFLEIARGKFVRVRQEMVNVVLDVVIFQIVHHVSAIALLIH